jgi:hypothetical protein
MDDYQHGKLLVNKPSQLWQLIDQIMKVGSKASISYIILKTARPGLSEWRFSTAQTFPPSLRVSGCDLLSAEDTERKGVQWIERVHLPNLPVEE